MAMVIKTKPPGVINRLHFTLAFNFSGYYSYCENFLPKKGREFFVKDGLRFSVTAKKPPPDLAKARKATFICGPGIGDALIMTPAFKLLKQLCPYLEIAVVASEPALSILDSVKGIDAPLPIPCGNYVPAAFHAKRAEVVLADNQRRPSDFYLWNWFIKSAANAKLKELKGYKITGTGGGTTLPLSPCADSIVSVLTDSFVSPQLPYVGIQWGLALLLPLFNSLDYLPKLDNPGDSLRPEISDNLSRNPKSKPGPIYFNFTSTKYCRTLSLGSSKKLFDAVSRFFPEREIYVSAGTKRTIDGHPKNYTEEEYVSSFLGSIGNRSNLNISPFLPLRSFVSLLPDFDFVIGVDTAISHIMASRQLSGTPSAIIFLSREIQKQWGLEAPHRYYYSPNCRYITNRPMEMDDKGINFILKAMKKELTACSNT